MANILIAGCGELGCPLGETLAQAGHQVFGIRRHIDQIPTAITPIQADLYSGALELTQSFDFVYYIMSATHHDDLAYYQAYVLGLKNVLHALEQQTTPVQRLFFVSSTSVFGQTEAEWVNEDSPVADHNFSTRRLLEGETLAQKSGINSTIIRFGGIYGPGRTHLIDQLLKGKVRCMDGVYSNRIHSADCVRMLAHLSQVKQPAPIYIGVDNAPTPICEVYEWLAEQLSVTEVEYSEPKEHSRQARSNKRLSNQKIKDSGFEFQYPSYQDGYAKLLENY